MEFGYNFEYALPGELGGVAEGAFAGAAGIFGGIMLIIYLLLLGVSVVCLVLNAVGMYRIAKRRGIHHPWLAWIPIGNSWLLGSISDHYQYIVKQKVTNRRKIMLIFNIILVAVSVLLVVSTVLLAVAGSDNMGGTILTVAMLLISYLAMLGLSITIYVFSFIALFDLFRSCRPEYDVLFLVLSIFLGGAVFVFACSGYDKGMPARRTPPHPAPVQIPSQPETPVQTQQVPEEELPLVETEAVARSEEE